MGGRIILAALALMLLIPCVRCAACAVPVQGVPSASVAQWTVIHTPVGFATEPFIFYVTQSGGYGTARCTDVRCANTATFTFQNTSNAPGGLEPAMVSRRDFSGYALIGLYDSAGGDLDCQSLNCDNSPAPSRFSADTTRGAAPAVQQGGSPTNPPFFYYMDPASNGQIRSRTCTGSDCTAAMGSNTVLTGGGTARITDPFQVAAINGSNGLPLLAYLRESASPGVTYLQTIACATQGCSSASPFSFITTFVSPTCRLSMILPPGGNPLIAYCDNNNDLKVFQCTASDCSAGLASVVLAPGVGTPGPSAPLPKDGGAQQLTIASRPCGSGFPIIVYTTFGGALGVIDCADAACQTAGTNRILYSSGASYASVTVPPVGHPLESMPIISFSYTTGSSVWNLQTLICLDGTCAGCDVGQPMNPSDPLLTPCNNPFVTTAPPLTSTAPPSTTPGPTPTPSPSSSTSTPAPTTPSPPSSSSGTTQPPSPPASAGATTPPPFVSGTTAPPSPSVTSTNPSSTTSGSSKKSSVPIAAVAGGAAGGALLIAAIVALLVYLLVIRKKRSLPKSNNRTSWAAESRADDEIGGVGRL